jgi:hypothetical protein
MDERQSAGLFSGVTNHAVFPINMFGIQIGDVALRPAQMPA